jgi:lipoprotein-anchoring transpeptidase ErfK/SrfK
MKKTATSLSIAAVLVAALAVPTYSAAATNAPFQAAPKPAATTQASPPVSSEIVSTPQATKGTLVAVNKSGKRKAAFKVYRTAGAGAKVQITLKNANKSRILFTVVKEEGDSYYVNLPARPNGSKGYIKKSDVTTFQNPFRIVVSLSEKRMSAYKGDFLIRSAKIAIGKASAPTPIGEFYTVWTRRPKAGTRGYGVYIIGISGFSNVYTKFGTGDGRVGMHGTYDDSLLGTPASAGCIRMSNKDITFLKETIFEGTPVLIFP